MAGSTTNIGLIKPTYSEDADVAIINENMDTLDSTISALDNGLAIVSNNNTHGAITAGQYVYVRNHGSLAEGMYTANSNIAANATLSSSNLTAVSSGSLNKLNSDLGTLNSNIEKVKYADFTISLTSGSGRTESVACGITGYVPIGATFLQNDDIYYLTVTDGIYPNLSLVTGSSTPYVQILGMNKSLSSVGATRNIKIRVIYTKA